MYDDANMTSFRSLQLIQQIHLHSQNPFFPQICVQVHRNLSNLHSHYVATYLLSLYQAYGPGDVLVRALRHPVCDVAVAEEMARIWDRTRIRTPPWMPYPQDDTGQSLYRDGDTSPPLFTSPLVKAPPLSCSEIPRRLLRHPSDPKTPVHPLLIYLFSKYSPSANSHRGYPLCRAVLTRNYTLLSFLLDRGADPSVKDALAIQVAISLHDLKSIKLLVERSDGFVGGNRAGKLNTKKRRRLGDRIVITPSLVECAMKKGSREIVEYFVQEKGELAV